MLLALLPAISRGLNPGRRAADAPEAGPARHSYAQTAAFVAFVASLAYVGGTLPCGRFYYEGVEGFFGNTFLKAAYQYIFAYLALGAHAVEAAERWVAGLPGRRPELEAVGARPSMVDRLLFDRARELAPAWAAEHIDEAEVATLADMIG